MKNLLCASALFLALASAAQADCVSPDGWLHGPGSMPSKVLLDVEGDAATVANDTINNTPPITHTQADHFLIVRPNKHPDAILVGVFFQGCLVGGAMATPDDILRNFGVDVSADIGVEG